jgi:hypothetical protein
MKIREVETFVTKSGEAPLNQYSLQEVEPGDEKSWASYIFRTEIKFLTAYSMYLT